MNDRGVIESGSNLSRSARSSLLVHAAPITTSLCPLRYLVQECITMSAPNVSGRCQKIDEFIEFFINVFNK